LTSKAELKGFGLDKELYLKEKPMIKPVKLALLALLIMMLSILSAEELKMNKAEVFYKKKPPSMKVLEQVKELLAGYEAMYQISYYDIEDEENQELILSYGLPSTHFPFAVVLNGRFTAGIDEKVVSFIHFPDFMHGIGRHEGNWSLDALNKALSDNTLLMYKNILPKLADKESDSKCEE
jgi:hypothetical protein